MTVKVLYILGLGHSGTTLLTRVLGAHSRIVATGGSWNVPRFLAGRRDCACGATAPGDCPFWSRVEAVLGERGLSLAELDLEKPHGRLDPESTRIYFEAVAEAAGAEAIVDTTRRPSHLRALARVPGLELYPVHIFKNPRRQIASAKRKGGWWLPTLWNYGMRGRRVRGLQRQWPNLVHVPYESFCRDPRGQLERMLAPAGLEVEDRQIESWGEQPIHILGGNRQRTNTSSEIRLDESWKERLTPFERNLVRVWGDGTWRRNLAASGESVESQ